MARPHRVVITDFIRDDLEPERRILGDQARVEALDAHDESELVGRVEDADALMVYHHLGVSAATIDRLDRCRLIVRCGVGYDNVDGDAAARRGIPLANVPDYGTEEVADSALALALALTRGASFFNARLRDERGSWIYTEGAPLYRLRGRVFGIVGLGRIGTAAALRARAFGFDVVCHDPYRPDGCEKALGIRRTDTLDELLGQAFVLSLHCPLTAETRNLIDATALERMPAGGYLVNTARGGVVEPAAVVAALATGHLAGAGIDVLEREPPPPDDPLVQAWRDPRHPAHDRLLLNPHAAFYSEEGLQDMRLKGAEACRRALRGEPVRNVVNGVGDAEPR